MITKDMTIGEVLSIDRDTARIFTEYGMHCMGCPHALSETIEEAGLVHSTDIHTLVDQLNQLVEKNKGQK